MTFLEDISKELIQEAAVTRRYLSQLPFVKKDYQPHPKSEKLGRLGIHLAEILSWWKACLEQDSLNFIEFEPQEVDSTEELLAYFDALLEMALLALRTAKEEELLKPWSMKYGVAF